MSDAKFEIRGIPAVILAVLILAGVGFKTFAARSSLPGDGQTALQSYYSMEYQRHILERDDISDSERIRLLNLAHELEIASISARGRGGDYVVRVQLGPSEAQPPGTSRTRYCEMKYSGLTGWRAEREVPGLSYHLKLF